MTLEKPPKTKQEWFALYTRPRAEKRVKAMLIERGIECYLPLHRTPRVWSDRIKLVDMPLFSSYIFVKSCEQDVQQFVYLQGIVRVVFNGGKPAVIKQREINAIAEFLVQAAGRKLCTGDEVEILSGSMKKIYGKVLKIKKKFIYLSLEHLAATVCVDIGNVAHKNRIR
ncbi:MAG: UpxY family transcription antiterminator [Tannerella sp.]|jgi:transcription antitermination factor NusG|nr:UpxY family transcription antiterminator [Tannerella sp.]